MFLHPIGSHFHIVDQPRRSHARGDRQHGRAIHHLHFFQRDRIDRRHVVDGKMLLEQQVLDAGVQPAGVADAALHIRLGAEQAPADRQRPLALVGRQVLVAAAHRQSARLAEGGAGDDLDRKIQRLGHRREDAKLLKILLPEDSEFWLDDIEKLRDYLAHAAKMPRPMRAIEHLCQRRQIDHDVRQPRTVHLLGRRQENQVNARRFALLQIRFDRPRIFVEILIRRRTASDSQRC